MALEGSEGSASRPDHSLPPGKTRYPLYRRLGGPQGRSGRVRKISPPPGFDRRTVNPAASRCTDWATPAHILEVPSCKNKSVMRVDNNEEEMWEEYGVKACLIWISAESLTAGLFLDVLSTAHLFLDSLNTAHLFLGVLNTAHLFLDILNTTHLFLDVLNTAHLFLDVLNKAHLFRDVLNTAHLFLDSLNTTHLFLDSLNTAHLFLDSLNTAHLFLDVLNTAHLFLDLLNTAHRLIECYLKQSTTAHFIIISNLLFVSRANIGRCIESYPCNFVEWKIN